MGLEHQFTPMRPLLFAVAISLGAASLAPSAQAIGDLTDLAHCTAGYGLTFHTADKSGAGTDANIDVTFKGSAPLYATKTIRINPYLAGNAFERNGTDRVTLCLDDQPYGYITQVTVKSDGSYAGSDWDFDSLKIQYSNGKSNTFKFDPNHTIGTNESVTRNSAEDTSAWTWGWYKVAIHTSDEAGGGTDSNISLTLKGNKGTTDRTRLNGLLSGNAFERNDTDTVVLFSSADVGQVVEVKLENDGNYAGSDWHVATVEVTDKTGKAITFKYNRWINSNSPVDELSSFQPIEAVPEGTQDFQFVTFKFKNNLTNPGEVTWTETLEYVVSDSIEMTTETGYSVGLSANAGWSAGDKGGAEASVGLTFDRFKNDNQSKVQGVQTKGTEAVERKVPANSFMVAKCTWTVPYDMYKVSASGVDTRMRVLKGQPRCAESVEVYGGPGDKAMFFTTWHAAMEAFGAQWSDVKRQLEAAGITLAGVTGANGKANVEFKNHTSDRVEIAFMPAPGLLLHLDTLAPGASQTWGPIQETMPILFLVGAASAGTYGAPVTGGTEIGSYVVGSQPKQLYVIQ